VTERDELIKIARETHSSISEALAKQERTLKYLAGEPYEPVAHEAQGILVGIFGGSAS